MRSINYVLLPVALLAALASADTKYYEAFGAPIFWGGSPAKQTKIGIGLDSDNMNDFYITQKVTVVFENVPSGAKMQKI